MDPSQGRDSAPVRTAPRRSARVTAERSLAPSQRADERGRWDESAKIRAWRSPEGRSVRDLGGIVPRRADSAPDLASTYGQPAIMPGATRNRRVALLLTLALLLAVGLLGRLWYVHDRTWDWSLAISATPPKIQFADRTYLRSTADMTVPVGAVDVARTLGGGVILSDQWRLTCQASSGCATA